MVFILLGLIIAMDFTLLIHARLRDGQPFGFKVYIFCVFNIIVKQSVLRVGYWEVGLWLWTVAFTAHARTERAGKCGL